jgi:hypothetical protein
VVLSAIAERVQAEVMMGGLNEPRQGEALLPVASVVLMSAVLVVNREAKK